MPVNPADWYDGVYAAKDYAAEAQYVLGVIDRHCPHAASLLDVACGTGRHLEHFAARFRCEGSDLDPTMLAVARRRLPDLTFTAADLVTLDLGRSFDVVTCLFSSIGYAHTPERLRAAVAALAHHVNPGGLLVVEPWFTLDRWDEQGRAMVHVIDDGLRHQAVRVLTTSTVGRVSVLHVHYVEARPGRIETEDRREEFGLFTADEYVEAVEAAGLAPTWDDSGPNGRALVTGIKPAS